MVADLQTHPNITPYRKQRAAEAGINAMLCVPVRTRQQIMGVLSITSKTPRLFTEDEAIVLSAYAEQAAIAIEHARLLAAEEERTALSERTNVILRDEIAERPRRAGSHCPGLACGRGGPPAAARSAAEPAR